MTIKFTVNGLAAATNPRYNGRRFAHAAVNQVANHVKSTKMSNYYGLQNLDARIEEHVVAEHGTFVELGAYDGVDQNNTLHFEQKGWRGVLIEPQPIPFAECCRNRPLAKVFNCACVPHGYQSQFVEMTAVGLMSVVNGFMEDPNKEESWICRGEQCHGVHRTKVMVPARTLDSILIESGVLRPDLLVLDVEGAELKVLQGLDLRNHRPKFIVCEDSYTSDVSNFLLEEGYLIRAVLLERDFTRDVLYVDLACSV